jgi:hypothetical protein
MSSLSDISTYDNASASITSRRRSSSVKTIPREEHTSYLTDTAGAVREVAKKLGNKKKKEKSERKQTISLQARLVSSGRTQRR